MKALFMQKKYLIEFILFCTYMLFAMSWVGATIFMPEIMKLAGMQTLTQASILSTSLTVAKIFGTAIAAWTITKFGIRNAFTLSSFLICFSIITPYVENYWLLLISRFLMGLGGALVIVYFNPIIYQYFKPEERAVVNGLNAIAFNVGTAIIMFGVTNFNAISGGWQHTLLYISIASILMLIIWLIFGRIELQKENQAQIITINNYTFTDGLKDKFNWIYALTYSGLLSFYIVLFTFYTKAGIIQTKQVILFGIVGIIAGIFYSNKIKRRLPIIRIAGLIQLVCVFCLSFVNNPILSLLSAASLGFFMFLPMPALVTYAQERPLMNAQKIAVTFSLFWSISYLVATIASTIFAKIVDISNGSYNLAFLFICIIEASFLIGSLILQED